MSITRNPASQHAEWLSLVEASGPFLSLKVLLEAFPQGLEPHDPEHSRRLRLAFDEWQASQESYQPNLAIHRAWVEFVLKESLEFTDEVLVSGQKIPENIKAYFAEHGETLRPDWMLINSSDVENEAKPRLLIQILPSNQDLEKRLAGSRWSASPATRMMELLHSTNIRLGLLTNGHCWMLVNAPRGETTGFISWYSNLWLEENITLRAFRSLLSLRRFFGVEANKTIESLLAQSADDQHEVTTQLGYQVRKAVEVLVQKFDKIDKDNKATKNSNFNLADIGEKKLYQAALTVMMRLVFLFSAEEQGLLLLGDTLFDNHYAVSTLRTKLREIADQYGEEVLERRSDAWVRLLATFRAVHSGVEHDSFKLPAYGGHLFDPDRFAFLEGRNEGTSWLETEAQPLLVDNRTVLHLLEALQVLQIKLPGGGSEPRRLSFRALDVEQIGHVYEGLLDHTAVRATSPVLGLEGRQYKEPEVLLEKLEQIKLKGEDELLKFLNDETGKSLSALKKLLSLTIQPQDEQKFIVACDNDQVLWQRVQPFAGLVRKDTTGYPIVINTGSVYVTQGQDRRSTGTHYTPRSLTEPIVQYTLEPIVYIGVAEGKPKEEWQLKPASELLKLKVCDFAMGSGAFLVQACRYLAERLTEAWEEAERSHPGQLVVTPEGTLSEGQVEESLIPKDPAERMLTAKRIIADRCIYGVDVNPMAVEMAKLSLWLVTMQKNRPFTFVDHALKCGDSLLGVTEAKQIEYFSLQPEKKVQSESIEYICKPLLETAIAKRKELESFTANDIQAVQRKEQLFLEAESALDKIRFLGDLLVGEALRNISKSADMTAVELGEVFREVTHALSDASDSYHNIKVQALRDKAKRILGNRKLFHWLLEFPEIFWAGNGNRGFDAIVGNPPFMGGVKITPALGYEYTSFIKLWNPNSQQNTDIVAYFFVRAFHLLNAKGCFGLIGTNTVAQTDTRLGGLAVILESDGRIYHAISTLKWPGTASLYVSLVHITKNNWDAFCVVDGVSVKRISSYLEAVELDTLPKYLRQSSGLGHVGAKPYGEGFVISSEEASILNNNSNSVVKPYLNGRELMSNVGARPSRWIIDFGDMKETEACNKAPECFEIVKHRVLPERICSKLPIHKNKWWLFGFRPNKFYEIVGEYYWACSQTSKYLAWERYESEVLFDQKLIAIPFGDFAMFSLLQNSLHEKWAIRYGSTLETRPVYAPTECLATFPFPKNYSNLDTIGEKYHSHRQSVMFFRQEGLTKTYNRFHNPNETSSDIDKLRQLHKEMDEAVANAYGWTDLDLGHGFHQTKQGVRYTICEEARREVLDRLLELNHERYAEEVAAGLHDTSKGKKKAASTSKSKASKAKAEEAEEVQGSLF